MNTNMNTIQPMQLGEPVSPWRNLGAVTRQFLEALVTEASGENAGVVGGSESGKDGVVNAGYLPGKDARASERPAGVRAVIVAQASQSYTTRGKTSTLDRSRVTTGGAKGGRKANASKAGRGELNPRQFQ